jgi:acetylornithine deacetylase/succinyl-diaminopimelate desuccinylase-like protein
MEGWLEGLGPVDPVIKDGKLYGRGSSDDGYAVYAAVLILKTLLKFNVDMPRVVILIEGAEESFEDHLIHYMNKSKDRIGKIDHLICLDSGSSDLDRFPLTTSLRGMCRGLLKVKVLTQGVHSGMASGVVPSSFRIARLLLNRVEDAKTGRLVDDFRTNMTPDRY